MHRLYVHQGFGLVQRGALLTKWRPLQSKPVLTSLMEDRQYSGVTASSSTLMPASRRTSLHWKFPGELWGAVNAVSAGLSSRQQPTSSAPSLACKAAMSSAPASIENIPSHLPDHIQERLNQRPQLQAKQLALVLLLPFLACVVLTLTVGPANFSLRWSLGMGLLYVAQTALLRNAFLEQQYKALQVTEAELADEDSKFREFDGLTVHYKAAAPPAPKSDVHETPCGLAMYHGFGANTFSWSFVSKRMAEQLGVTVVSHDMPGFGLTQRSPDIERYTISSNGRLGRLLLDAELCPDGASKVEKDQAKVISINVQAGSPDRTAQHGKEPKRILVGHSLGAACAAAEIIDHPEGIDGLILVAPAMVAPMFQTIRAPSNSGRCQKEGNALKASFEGPEKPQEEKKRRGMPRWLRNTVGVMQVLVAEAAAWFARCLLWLLQPVMVLGLRSAVRSRAFWQRGLGSAWFQKTGVTSSILDAYRLPQLAQGWEWGMLRFLRARVTSGQSVWKALRSGYGQAERSQAQRLKAVVAEHKIKVLIIHGESDALVPRWNSQKLAALLGADLEVFPDCGHMPMEEMPDRFISTVAKFASRCRSSSSSR